MEALPGALAPPDGFAQPIPFGPRYAARPRRAAHTARPRRFPARYTVYFYQEADGCALRAPAVCRELFAFSGIRPSCSWLQAVKCPCPLVCDAYGGMAAFVRFGPAAPLSGALHSLFLSGSRRLRAARSRRLSGAIRIFGRTPFMLMAPGRQMSMPPGMRCIRGHGRFPALRPAPRRVAHTARPRRFPARYTVYFYQEADGCALRAPAVCREPFAFSGIRPSCSWLQAVKCPCPLVCDAYGGMAAFRRVTQSIFIRKQTAARCALPPSVGSHSHFRAYALHAQGSRPSNVHAPLYVIHTGAWPLSGTS